MCFLGLLSVQNIWAVPDPTLEEILDGHRKSIGSAADRQKMFNLTAVGEVGFVTSVQTTAPYVGKAVYATESDKLLLAIKFDSAVYQMEKIVFDGKSQFVAFSQPGQRSILGDFMFRYSIILKQALMMGVLSKNWALLNPEQGKAKVSLDGTKKIDGQETYVINYEPKKGSDVRIKIYLDKATFRHVRTEYSRLNSAGASSNPNTSSQLSENHENMTEEYSDFKTEYGVTLPRTYKIKLYIERNRAIYENSYTFKFQEFFYNSKLDDKTFVTDAR